MKWFVLGVLLGAAALAIAIVLILWATQNK